MGKIGDERARVVDQRGILAEIYSAGNLAYVGGGFRRQIHSIVEPVAHGLPVAFGPNFQRSPEAMALTAAGGAKSVSGHGAAAQLPPEASLLSDGVRGLLADLRRFATLPWPAPGFVLPE